MRNSFIFFSLLCLAAYTECYGGRGHDPLRELLKMRNSRKQQANYLTDDVSDNEYSSVYVARQDGLKKADEIVKLPGQPTVDFNQYSGYVTVNRSAGRALFYYFVEAEYPSNKPLVLWLNGGPGCSSLGTGAMTELGPFRVNPDEETLWHNKFAWNNVANVLFLESPAGVGFSYSNDSLDYITGDERTAKDSYTFLVNWLERFPEYKNRDFFMTGESYAGHYIPQLADLILKYNKITNNKTTNQTIINLKGIAMGNAYIDFADRWYGTFDHLRSSALISDEFHQKIKKVCDFSSYANLSRACKKLTSGTSTEMGNIYPYDAYAPLCHSPPTPSISSYDPCSPNYVSAYLNSSPVKKALHAKISAKWQDCNQYIFDKWLAEPDTVLPLIKNLTASGLRVWLYSGDTDVIIPVTSTKYSVHKLGGEVKSAWRPWYSQGETAQVGGYVVGYQNMTFVTLRGSGHMGPSYQPERAFTMFSSFLQGKLPPEKKGSN